MSEAPFCDGQSAWRCEDSDCRQTPSALWGAIQGCVCVCVSRGSSRVSAARIRPTHCAHISMAPQPAEGQSARARNNGSPQSRSPRRAPGDPAARLATQTRVGAAQRVEEGVPAAGQEAAAAAATIEAQHLDAGAMALRAPRGIKRARAATGLKTSARHARPLQRPPLEDAGSRPHRRT